MPVERPSGDANQPLLRELRKALLCGRRRSRRRRSRRRRSRRRRSRRRRSRRRRSRRRQASCRRAGCTRVIGNPRSAEVDEPQAVCRAGRRLARWPRECPTLGHALRQDASGWANRAGRWWLGEPGWANGAGQGAPGVWLWASPWKAICLLASNISGMRRVTNGC